MKKYFLMSILLTAFALCAEVVDINGGFEQIKPELGGKISPAGWMVQTKLSRNYEYMVSKTPGTFRTGNFGLVVETQQDGRIYFQRLDRMKFPVGKKLKFSFWAKGSGRIYMGFFCFGSIDGKPETFIRTLLNTSPQLNNVEEWKEYTFYIPLVPQKVKDVTYTDLRGRICMYFPANCELYLDDIKVEIVDGAAK